MAELLQFLSKAIVAFLVVGLATYIGKRDGTNYWSALIASLPYNTLLTLIILHLDPGTTTKMEVVAIRTGWATVATATFALGLGAGLRLQLGFYQSLILGLVLLILAQLVVKQLTVHGII